MNGPGPSGPTKRGEPGPSDPAERERGDFGRAEPVVYGLHGLRIRSPVPLAGFPLDNPAHDVDVDWTKGAQVPPQAPEGMLVAEASLGGTYLYVAADDGDRWTLRVPGFCDFVVSRDRQTVECRVDPSADPDFVAILLAGLVVAFLLGLDGHCVLHASAVEVEGMAIAFACASGAGKSTLAALLCAYGGRMVTDDLLRIGLTPQPVCVGGSPQLRLRPGAAWALDEFPVRPSPTVTVDQRLALRPEPTRSADTPLAVIVLPRLSRQARRVEITPATGAASVARLAGVGRVGWTDPHVQRAQFHALAQLAARVPVVEALIPWEPSTAPADGPGTAAGQDGPTAAIVSSLFGLLKRRR